MSLSEEQYLHLLALNFVPNIGSVMAKTLISYCGGIKEVFNTPQKELIKIPTIGQKRANDILSSDTLKQAEEELKHISSNGIKMVSYLDDDYPHRLKHYPDAPLILFYKGEVDFNVNRTVAIVGTRKITSYGTIQCEKLVQELIDYNVTIVSGLAYGVDTCAHRKALELNIPTIGVLGNGLANVYPASNRKIAQQMTQNGGLVSELKYYAKPDRENFPMRNRIIAGMSDVVVVIESGASGGSMITAEIANNYNKDVFAIPGKLGDDYSKGCNQLIKIHKAHLLTSAKDIEYIMRWDQSAIPKQLPLIIDLDDDERQVVNILRENGSLGLDKLHYSSEIPLFKLTSILLTLEFKGLLKSLPGKKYILT